MEKEKPKRAHEVGPPEYLRLGCSRTTVNKDCKVACWMLKDGGCVLEFRNGEAKQLIRLSKEGYEALKLVLDHAPCHPLIGQVKPDESECNKNPSFDDYLMLCG